MAFKRVVELLVGPEGQENRGYSITDLKISFEVIKTIKESTNIAKIRVFNVSEATSVKMSQYHNKVILRAGYEDETVQTLFYGDLVRAIRVREGADAILEIEAHDGVKQLTSRRITLGYSAGTPVKTVLNDIISAAQLPLAQPLPEITKQYVHGYSFAPGLVKNALTEVLRFIKKNWTVQNGQLVIFDPGAVIENTRIYLSKETGLIQHPEPLIEKADELSPQVPLTRWKVFTIMIPHLYPGITIEINSSTTVQSAGKIYKLHGLFVVESAKCTGDNWSGGFGWELEVRQA